MIVFRLHMQILIMSLIGFIYTADSNHGFYVDSWALLIGINSYHNEPHLNYAVADAQRMHSLLTEKLDFPPDNINTFFLGL